MHQREARLGVQKLAAQDFHHAIRESVSGFIHCLEKIFQHTYSRENLMPDTCDTLLMGGSRMEIHNHTQTYVWQPRMSNTGRLNCRNDNCSQENYRCCYSCGQSGHVKKDCKQPKITLNCLGQEQCGLRAKRYPKRQQQTTIHAHSWNH